METLEFLNRAFRNIDLPPLSDDDMRDIGDALRSTRPTPDGEIGEDGLLERLQSHIDQLERDGAGDDVRLSFDDLCALADRLETQAADIARLREALRVAARRLEIVSETMAEQGFGQSVNLDACALMARAALATRTDVR